MSNRFAASIFQVLGMLHQCIVCMWFVLEYHSTQNLEENNKCLFDPVNLRLIDFEIRYSNQPLASINISFQKSMITHTYLTRRQYNYGLLITYILSGSVLHIQLGMKLEHDSQG
jgi:hypothetical protein